MGRPINWPDVADLSPKQLQAELACYNAGTEVKPIAANFERAGLGSVDSLSYESTMREAEGLEDSHSPALRVTELRLLVGDKPRHVSPIVAKQTLEAYNTVIPAMVAESGGACHSRPVKTKIVRCLGSDSDLSDCLESMALVAIFMRDDVIASPNQAPRRKAVVYSAGRDVQRHVISEPVAGEYLPMRQVADANQASYETINVDSLPNGPLVLSDLQLELGIESSYNRRLMGIQLDAAIRAIRLAVAMGLWQPDFETMQVYDLHDKAPPVSPESATIAPKPQTPNYWQLRHIQLSAKWPNGALRNQAIKTRCHGQLPVVA